VRIVFMGTPEFAAKALEALIHDGQDIVLAVSQPDKPKGRGYRLEPSEVKKLALAHGIEVITPNTLKDESVIEKLKSANADVFIVAAYGKILPKAVLDIPPLGCINIHASLLPALRGAAPINRAIMEGHTKGGITIMYMEEGLDTGDIILQEEIAIPPDMTAGEYHDRLAVLGGECIVRFLQLAESGNIPRIKQDESLATYAKKIEKSDCLVTFRMSPQETVNQIRGLNPFPGAFVFLNGKRIKIYQAKIGAKTGEPGEILAGSREGIEVACGDGSVVLTELCCEGKCRMGADEYVCGNKVEIGAFFNV